MDDEHRKILRQNWVKIRQDLEPKKLLPSLVNILDEEDVERIKGEEGRLARCDELLGMLQRRGQNAFDAFVKALESTNQAYLALDLTKQSGKNLFIWLIFLFYRPCFR